MGLYCILCGRKDKSVSYLREKNIYDSHRLCTDHFKPEDLRKRSRCVVVQAEAVPCIYFMKAEFSTVENASKSNDDNICSIGIMSNDPRNDNINVNYLQSTTVIENMDSDPIHYTGIGKFKKIPPNNCLILLIQEGAYCNSKKRRLDSDSIELISNDSMPIQKLPVYYFIEITLLKDLISDLKKRNYISESIAHILMVRLNGIYRSMKATNKDGMT
ncbi:hypothetical protein ACFW04_014259 [Cataglyphis niger]